MTATFRGVVDARAVIVDPTHCGVDAARRRVVQLGSSELRQLPDGRWLVVFAVSRELRADRGPGQPLTEVEGGGLTMPGVPGERGAITWLSAGLIHRARLDELPPLSTVGWLDPGDTPVVRMTPLDIASDAAPARPVRLVEPPVFDPDLRASARVTVPSGRSARRRRRLTGGRAETRPVFLIALGFVIVAVIVATAVAGTVRAIVGPEPSDSFGLTPPATVSSTSGPTPGPMPTSASDLVLPPELSNVPTDVLSSPAAEPSGHDENIPSAVRTIFLAVVLALVVWWRTVRRRRRTAVPSGGARRDGPDAGPGFVRRLLLRVVGRPAAGVFARRQERYLRRLTGQFERRDWQDLLGDGIALGGSGAGWISLTLPPRRKDLRITTSDGSGTTVPFTGDAAAYLRALYSEAARDLERAGDIERAVFVHAELLRDLPAAVALLEREGRYRLAAELAEGRGDDPAMAVRLWWRAGERTQAVRVARARNVFAPGVARLASVDATAAVELRRAWVDACRAAGDPLAAVRAAWPAPELRAEVRPDLAAGMQLGGEIEGQLLARTVTAFPDEHSVRHALDLLAAEDRMTLRVREGFVAELHAARQDGEVADPAVDRQLCSAAVRRLLVGDVASSKTVIRQLAARADPLLRSDLPVARAPGLAAITDPAAPEAPGQLAVRDAVTVAGPAVLVAHGEAGTAIYGFDGRVRARWDVPADYVVVGDNGATALLVREAGPLLDVHRLDIVTRKVRHWSLLHGAGLVRSFDGAVALLLDRDGLAFVDTTAEDPTVLWRELAPERYRALALNRTPSRLTGIVVDLDRPDVAELWVWDTASRLLRVRRPLAADAPATAYLAADNTALLYRQVMADDPRLTYVRGYDDPIVVPLPESGAVSADGSTVMVQRVVGDRLLATVDLAERPDPLCVTFPASAEQVAMRSSAGTGGFVTVHDGSGRIVVIDEAGGPPAASFVTDV